MGEFEPPLALGHRAGECALFVAKKFAFDQIFRNRGAIDFDKRRIVPGTLTIQRARHQFLAGAAFARNQHGRLRTRDFADQLAQAFHRGADSLEFVAGFVFLGVAEVRIDLEELVKIFRFLQGHLQLIRRKRLEHVIERPVSHAIDGGFNRPMSRHHNHERLLGLRLQFPQQTGAFAIGQANIEENQIEGVASQIVPSASNGVRTGDVVALLAQHLFKVFADDQVVLENDDFFNGHAGCASCGTLASIEVGNEMRTLLIDRWNLSRRNKPAAQGACSFSRSIIMIFMVRS